MSLDTDPRENTAGRPGSVADDFKALFGEKRGRLQPNPDPVVSVALPGVLVSVALPDGEFLIRLVEDENSSNTRGDESYWLAAFELEPRELVLNAVSLRLDPISDPENRAKLLEIGEFVWDALRKKGFPEDPTAVSQRQLTAWTYVAQVVVNRIWSVVDKRW